MDEEAMVKDILSEVKSNLMIYQKAILETENIQLRQTIQQIRNNLESFQYELVKISETKEYYKPTSKVNAKEISNVKKKVEEQ